MYLYVHYPTDDFGRHDCGVRGGVFWKPAGGASDTVLETEDGKKPEDSKKIDNFM